MLAVIQQNLIWFSISSLILGVVSLFLILFLMVKNYELSKKSRVFFSGKDAKSLESIIRNQAEKLEDLDKEIQELFEIVNKINNLAQHSLHKVGIIRYNPFKDLGGDQSFAIALLDGKNSGLVVSSLHTREGTRVYAKPIIKGESKKYPLTEEEKQAIKISSTTKESVV
jgi:hypothetical protein